MDDVRIGIVGTDNTHAYTYAAFINGWAEDAPIPVRLPSGVPVPDMYLWAMLLRRLENDPGAAVPLPGARVTAIWSEDPADAEMIARACGIETVCARPEEVADHVDAVMILSERPETHLPYARAGLERGLPTYVDKPLAHTLEAGREIFALADRCGAPCYTGSAVRWAPELRAARDEALAAPGGIRAVYVQCPLELELYGIHAVEMVNMLVGSDVESVQAMSAPDRQVVLLGYRGGVSAVFEHLRFVRWPTYTAAIHSETWHRHVTIREPAAALFGFVGAFVEFARGGPVPVPADESLHLIEIVAQARQALGARLC